MATTERVAGKISFIIRKKVTGNSYLINLNLRLKISPSQLLHEMSRETQINYRFLLKVSNGQNALKFFFPKEKNK